MPDLEVKTSAVDTAEAGERRRSKVGSVISQVLLAIVALAFMFPIIYMFTTSLKIPAEVFTTPPTFIGSEFRWENYSEALNYAPFGKYLFNSLLVAVIGTVLNMAVAAFSGYAFSRLKWRFSGLVFMLFMATMMIPMDVLVVPLFIMMQGLDWVDSFQALILPSAFSAFGAFLLRQFFLTIPQELDDAARVDGAGVMRTFLTIMLPLAKPTLSVLAVFSFMTYWNAFLWPLIVINDVNTYGTIPIGLQQFFAQNGASWHLVMAASAMSVIPSILLLILLQKNLIKGIVTSGMGGR